MAGHIIPEFLSHFVSSTFSSEPRPGLQPVPGSKPITIEAALCPPLVYYVALLFLAPAPPPAVDTSAIKLLRNILALVAAALFFRLPIVYHVPQSIGLTYQLGLVGIYGGCRVLDAFFLGPYLFGHIPRRVIYHHISRPETPATEHPEPDFKQLASKAASASGVDPQKANGATLTARRPSLFERVSASDLSENMTSDSYSEILSNMIMNGPKERPVFETATTEDGWPHGFVDRASWAFELEMSMRGVGFTWTTADIRHTRKTWLPTVANRLHSIFLRVGPVILVSWSVIKWIYVTRLAPHEGSRAPEEGSPFDEYLTFPLQIVLTTALGAFLMAAFSLAHSIFAIMLSPLAPHPLAFFPALYSTRIWEIKSVRGFWSYGWHRLFARLFLVWGVWPGQWLERKLLGKTKDQRADVGKVLGGFISSAFVHSFSVRGVLGGRWSDAMYEARFFALNGAAVVFEGGIQRLVKSYRKRNNLPQEMWYDNWIGRVWWVAVLLSTGTNFARGWTKSSLVREMAFM